MVAAVLRTRRKTTTKKPAGGPSVESDGRTRPFPVKTLDEFARLVYLLRWRKVYAGLFWSIFGPHLLAFFIRAEMNVGWDVMVPVNAMTRSAVVIMHDFRINRAHHCGTVGRGSGSTGLSNRATKLKCLFLCS
jgi:hypothetical protein